MLGAALDRKNSFSTYVHGLV